MITALFVIGIVQALTILFAMAAQNADVKSMLATCMLLFMVTMSVLTTVNFFVN